MAKGKFIDRKFRKLKYQDIRERKKSFGFIYFCTNKVYISQKMGHEKIGKKIYLPPKEFSYELPNLPITSFIYAI